jgi:hypothetical protein
VASVSIHYLHPPVLHTCSLVFGVIFVPAE